MNYRKILAFAAALTMVTALASCGKDSDDETAAESIVISETDESLETADESSEDNTAETKEEDKKESETTKAKSKKTKEKTTASTTAKDSTATTAAGAAANSGGQTSSDGNSGNTASSGGSSAPSDNSGGASSGSTDSGNTSSGGESGESASPENTAEETKTFDAEITFAGAPSVSGSNAEVSGNSVVITSGGDYHITGSSSDGQIVVETATEEKVKIVLDGVDLTCSSGPALFIREAKKCTVELADGSSNSLQDTAKDKVYDGVIFSNDTLRIKGGGSLNITAGNRHGIASDDDIFIEGGTYVINSVKTGIFAHEGVTVNGGDLTINGGTNGIKSYNTKDPSKAFVEINGGNLVISGGMKEEKSSIYAPAFRYNGGNVYATGNKVTEPETAASPYAVFYYPEGGAAGSSLTLSVDGVAKAAMTPQSNFKCALMLSPDIHSGSKVTSELNGTSAEFEITDTKNVFTVE